MALSAVAAAYSQGADAWADGPIRVYGRLASLLVASAPTTLEGRRVLDLGAGTGAASRPAAAAGARVLALDLALGMLEADRAGRPPGIVGDALALPCRAACFDAVIAAFSLNHLPDPTAGAREVRRVLAPGGVLLATTYASDDDHPVKRAVEQALTEQGWSAPAWYPPVQAAMRAWGTEPAATAVVEAAGLEPVRIEHRRVPFPDLGLPALVGWRLGMAYSSGFVGALRQAERESVVSRAIDLLGRDPPPLVRSVIFIVARAR